MWGCTHLHSSRRLIHCKQCLPLCATIFFHKLCAGICNCSYSVCGYIAVTLCASCRSLWLCSFCLLEGGGEADEEIVRDCSGLS